MPHELEASLERYFRKSVRQAGGLTYKIVPIEAGMPDRLVLWPMNRIMLVELKTETGRLAPIQVHWHAKVAELGVIVDTLYGRPQVDAWIERNRNP